MPHCYQITLVIEDLKSDLIRLITKQATVAQTKTQRECQANANVTAKDNSGFVQTIKYTINMTDDKKNVLVRIDSASTPQKIE